MKKHFLLLWLLLLGSIGLVAAQSRQVQGVVKSAEGEALPGVTVLVEGTTNGASTGANGDYSITLPAGSNNPTLRFSFIGYATQAVKVGSQSTINVTLATDNRQLEDVVVIGYQTVERRDVTGSVSSVGAKQLRDIPVNSAAEALTGRLAGVQLTSSEGAPGNGSVQVRVRGGGSITQDNSPLYVVDGVQIENALSVIAPQDIQSVDVLKDASATAIYGARGANGVVIITTKSGRDGRTSVNYNGFAGFRELTKKLGVMGPADYLDWEYERAQLTGVGASGGLSTFKSVFGSLNFTGDTLARLRSAPNQDWQEQVFGRRAFQQTHNVSVSGGNKATTYALSLTSNKEDGIQIGSGYERKLINFRLDTKATDRLRLGVNVRYNDQANDGAGTGAAVGTSTTGQAANTGSSVTSRLRNAVQYVPFNLPNSAGADPTANFDPEFFTNSSLINPVLAVNNEYRNDRRRTFNLGGTVAFNITNSLIFRSTGGVDFTYGDLGTFNGLYSPTIRQAAGGYQNLPFATITTGLTTTYNNSNVLDYTFKKDKSTFNAILGEEIYQQRATQQFVQVNFLPADISAERALANINQAVLPVGTFAQPVLPSTGIPVYYRLLSGFGRLNYSFDDKYLFTLTGRMDGSSKFAPGNRSRIFPGASAAWRISKEDFFADYANTVSDLKLRLSYGQAGNNRIGDNLFSQNYLAGNTSYALNHVTTPASATTSFYNPDLKWEVTTTRNVGVDLALFNNRVQFTADAYYNTTSDLLVNASIFSGLGYATQLQNIGSTSNRGLELQLSSTIVQTPDFTWSATANAAFNRGRIESLGGGAQEIQNIQSGWAGTALAGADYVARVGSPVGQMFGYITDGFYTANDFESYNYATRTGVLKRGIANNLSTTGNPLLSIGNLKLKDVNGDGQLTEADKTVIGNANPKVVGGLNQQFSYKGFDASMFLNFVLGNDIYNANKLEFTTSTANTSYANLLGEMTNRVRYIDERGALIADQATFERVNANASIWSPVRGNYLLHSYGVEDGSFLRINNVTFGYSLPKSVISKVKATQLRFYVTLNNVYTFTKYSGYDPEVNTRRGTPLTPGVDYAAYPRSRALLFGINLGL